MSLPDPLTRLIDELVRLPGIGPKTAKLLDRLLAKDAGEARVLDLLLHLPYAAIDRRNRPKIADAPLDTIVTLEVKAIEHRPPGARSKAPYKVLVEDEQAPARDRAHRELLVTWHTQLPHHQDVKRRPSAFATS